jgi:hypothetical protein
LPIDDFVRSIQRRRVVERDVSSDIDAELGGVLNLLKDIRGLQKRFRWDTATVEAGAPQLVDFDDYGVEPELCGADGRHVAARPPTDEDDVECLAVPRAVLLICHANCALFPITDSCVRIDRRVAEFRAGVGTNDREYTTGPAPLPPIPVVIAARD